jgi:hypothetical protein
MPIIYARHPAGFLIKLDDVDRHQLDEAVTWLVQHGYRPDLPGDGWQRTPDGEPLCPRHGVAMSKRERQGDTWHSHRVIHPQTGEECWCRGFPHPSNAADGFQF